MPVRFVLKGDEQPLLRTVAEALSELTALPRREPEEPAQDSEAAADDRDRHQRLAQRRPLTWRVSLRDSLSHRNKMSATVAHTLIGRRSGDPFGAHRSGRVIGTPAARSASSRE